MTREYLRQVDKALSLPRGKKKEILRDLQEAFDSAAEHGESAEQVIRRLGTPQQFAQAIQEPDSAPTAARRSGRGWRWGMLAAWVVAAAFLAASWIVHQLAVPEGVIGQANGMTAIQVEGGFPLNASQLFLIAGLAAAAAGLVIAAVHLLRQHKKVKKEDKP